MLVERPQHLPGRVNESILYLHSTASEIHANSEAESMLPEMLAASASMWKLVRVVKESL